jgi:hypothetical protein
MRDAIVQQVQANCHMVSGAQAGYFSLCGLLLRLRQLYKWEHGLLPWQEPDPAPILTWIEGLENAWDILEDAPPAALSVNGQTLDPFAVEDINACLAPMELAYGAGLSRGLVPTFFLGELAEVRRVGEVTIFVLDRELARDLDSTPALCQENLVYARRQTLAYHLWDRLADPGQQENRFLKAALKDRRLSLSQWWGDPGRFRPHFEEMLAEELESAIHHELGEIREAGFRDTFRAVVSRFPQTRADHYVRALKDALAEVNEAGRLAYLIRERRFASLALFLAWQPGFYPYLLPEMDSAFCALSAAGDWDAVEEARGLALGRLRRTAGELTDLLAAELGDADTLEEMESGFIKPLGI